MSLDLKSVSRTFGRAASEYDQHAELQREVGGRLLERLDGLKFEPRSILDLGCGTGAQTLELRQRFPDARILAMDTAVAMLGQAAKRRGWWRKRFDLAAGDANALPLADTRFDLVLSNLMLQWCNDVPAVLANLRRVLKPGGMLLLSSFGLDTLRELRAAWASVDAHPRVSRFTDVQRLGSALTRSGFAEPVLDTDWITATYQNPRDLLRELKGIGASNAASERCRGLTTPGRLKAMLEAYESFRRPDRLYPATWEVLYASAWAPDPGQPVRTDYGEEASIPVASLGIRRR
ncbi:MAG: malonyl-ACP O-methyltransferase BioC [Wenzhouxiangella sp.]|jgi:malonyl-CoA O-methyltransferase|nr:malonyl-ACP O-methyltransferase BioC [Wenzhouxiangella sp.]